MPDDRKINALPLETRRAPLNSFNAEARTASVIVSAGSPVKRYDWANDRYFMEELVISAAAIDMTRLNGSGVSVLNNHGSYVGLEAVLGRASNGRIEGQQLIADVRFSSRDELAGLVRDIGDGIISDVSVGYSRDQIEMVAPTKANGMWTYRITRWTPMEVSFVTVPADPQAGMRSAEQQQSRAEQTLYPVEFINAVPAGADFSRKESIMSEGTQATVAGADPTAGVAVTEVQRQAISLEAAKAERTRSADIRKAVRAAELDDTVADELINTGVPIDQARAQIFDKMVDAKEAKQKQAGGTDVRGMHDIQMGEDGAVKVRNAMTSAIEHRLDSSVALPDNGAAEFRHMSMLRLAEDLLERRGIKTRGMRKLELATRAFGTTDFPAVLANVANKRLRNGYDENPGTYQQWAYKAPNAPDFKTITVTQISAAPDFLLKNPGDELKYGSASDGKEQYAMLTYARGIKFTREAMINDDMRAFDRLVTGFGASARRLENRLVYIAMVSNPTLGNDSVALFHATHANLTASGTAISVAALGVARKLMRKQTGLQGEVLNLAPKFLIVPAALEQIAYQFTSNQFVPATSANINEFRAGGKTALTPIVEAQLDSLTSIDGATSYTSGADTAWFLAADQGQVDTVEYCYLDGYDGVWLEQEVDFDTDALRFKGRLDFATKAVDYRGLYKNVGA